MSLCLCPVKVFVKSYCYSLAFPGNATENRWVAQIGSLISNNTLYSPMFSSLTEEMKKSFIFGAVSPTSLTFLFHFHWKDWCWSWNSNTLAACCKELTHWKRPWRWERLKAGGEGDNRAWDGWMASLTQWTWVWASSRSWWWTGRVACCGSWGRKESDMTEQLNWIDIAKWLRIFFFRFFPLSVIIR